MGRITGEGMTVLETCGCKLVNKIPSIPHSKYACTNWEEVKDVIALDTG